MKKTLNLGIAAAVIAVATGISAAATAGAVRAPIKPNGTTCFDGYAYSLDSGNYRYTAHNEQTRKNGKLTHWQVTYVGRQGQVIARKTLNFTANQTVPTYKMTVPQSGYMEGIRHSGSRWWMVRREKQGAKAKRKSFKIKRPIAGDAGFNTLVKQHFAALQSGKTLKFRFVAAGKLSVINLKAFKAGTTTFDGQKAVVFKAELNMFLIHFLVGSLKLTYNPDTHRLLEYRGIGNVHNKQGNTYSVRVDYDPTMPAVARQHGAPAPGCQKTNNNAAS